MTDNKKQALRDLIRGMESVVVTFSGGIDSALLAKVAYEELGDRALALTGISPSLSGSELDEARELAREMGIPHAEVETLEMSDPQYLSNTMDRCYFCKKELFTVAVREAKTRGYRCVLEGTHAEDLGGHRPGYQAARELNVRSPYVELGFVKAEIRELALELGLKIWNKPALACLASRIPTGMEITAERLSLVERAESLVRQAGAIQCRARYHESLLRLELVADEFHLLADRKFRDRIVKGCRSLGFRSVVLDCIPYGGKRPRAEQAQPLSVEEIRQSLAEAGCHPRGVFLEDGILRLSFDGETLAGLASREALNQLNTLCQPFGCRHNTLDLAAHGEVYIPLAAFS